MQKRQAHDSDPSAFPSGATATPRVSGEQPAAELPQPESSTRSAPIPLVSSVAPGASSEPAPGASSEPSDTLLSAGKPADRLEVLLEDRLATVDDRIRELDARISVLERKKPSAAPDPRQQPWLWIAFLIALVVVFQLLQRMR